ncbi:hypothetical protein D9757_011996 [Collybiopsis confluens]|uniref:Uncharacterized protein n=1 Tax=Collybiopsis confluens TaxID=2823264 RepID=A0A8H5GR30_9AGAR|nr:hypothetical protein D9757_011996 [Collybiopsis confluens]
MYDFSHINGRAPQFRNIKHSFTAAYGDLNPYYRHFNRPSSGWIRLESDFSVRTKRKADMLGAKGIWCFSLDRHESGNRNGSDEGPIKGKGWKNIDSMPYFDVHLELRYYTVLRRPVLSTLAEWCYCKGAIQVLDMALVHAAQQCHQCMFRGHIGESIYPELIFCNTWSTYSSLSIRMRESQSFNSHFRAKPFAGDGQGNLSYNTFDADKPVDPRHTMAFIDLDDGLYTVRCIDHVPCCVKLFLLSIANESPSLPVLFLCYWAHPYAFLQAAVEESAEPQIKTFCQDLGVVRSAIEQMAIVLHYIS